MDDASQSRCFSQRIPRISTRLPLIFMALFIALLSAACGSHDPGADEARREYSEVLRLSKNGAEFDALLPHLDRCIQLYPGAAECLERRANIRHSEGHETESLTDFSRALRVNERPYLRFERADTLCTLGQLQDAMADLNRAIAAQPDNVQFYPRRAYVHLALGDAASARADFARIGVPLAGYTLAALELLERRPAQAITALNTAIGGHDAGIGRADGVQVSSWRTLRMLAHQMQGDSYQVSATLDAVNLLQAKTWPEYGYDYWLTPRGCSNAFFATWARPLVQRAKAAPLAAPLVAAPRTPTAKTQPPPVPSAAEISPRRAWLATQKADILLAHGYLDDPALRGFLDAVRASSALALCTDRAELQLLAPQITITGCSAPSCPDGHCAASECQGRGPKAMESREVDIGATCTAVAFVANVGGLLAGQRLDSAAMSAPPSDGEQGFAAWSYRFHEHRYSLRIGEGRKHGASLELLRDGRPIATLFELDHKDELSCGRSPWMGDLNADGAIDVMFQCQRNTYEAWDGLSLSQGTDPDRRQLILQRETGGID